MVKKHKIKFPSELRHDLISGDWVVIATGRAKRPQTFKRERVREKRVAEKDCPFCQINKQKKPTLIVSKGKELPLDQGIPKEWTTISVPNKYPAFIPNSTLDERVEAGFYHVMNAAGFHEVVVTRSHTKQIANFSVDQVKEVLEVYQNRYLSLMDKKFVNHISIFHNHGKEAGASVAHPHSQIITTPLIDSDLHKALVNSEKYFKQKKKCIYCQMIAWELKVKKRIVFEDKEFLAICPFASKSAFQVIITPKNHLPHFERLNEEEMKQLAQAFQAVMKKIYKGLGDPAYNFYLHTAPCDGGNYPYYHWHWTILPKTATWAGFELGAKMEISTIEPEKAAEYLRKQ